MYHSCRGWARKTLVQCVRSARHFDSGCVGTHAPKAVRPGYGTAMQAFDCGIDWSDFKPELFCWTCVTGPSVARTAVSTTSSKGRTVRWPFGGAVMRPRPLISDADGRWSFLDLFVLPLLGRSFKKGAELVIRILKQLTFGTGARQSEGSPSSRCCLKSQSR